MNSHTTRQHFVSWEPEGRYHYSTKFRWEPEGRYRCTMSMHGNSALLILSETSFNSVFKTSFWLLENYNVPSYEMKDYLNNPVVFSLSEN